MWVKNNLNDARTHTHNTQNETNFSQRDLATLPVMALFLHWAQWYMNGCLEYAAAVCSSEMS